MDHCPICGRELIDDGKSVDKHHLIPKTFGGKETIILHRVCHQKIHATFSERDLSKFYSTAEAILGHEEIQKFVKWVRKKDPTYYSINRDTKERKGKRRR